MKISVCLIVKNEEKHLDKCLQSVVNYVDEIIITDTGSNDKTVEIAEKYTDNIFHYKWDDNFAAARNFCQQYAT
jgi:glycosyltransferase involved in cell wall biosynthesis